MIVLTGTTEMLVQLSSRISEQDKKAKRTLFYSYLTNYLSQGDSCKNTLEGLQLKIHSSKPKTLQAAAAQSDTVSVLKNSDGNNVISFSSSEGKERLRTEFGVDHFDKLQFSNFAASDGADIDFNTVNSSLPAGKQAVERGKAQLILYTRSFLHGKIPQFQKNFILNLTGVEIQKDGHGTGKHKVTACSASSGGLNAILDCAKLDEASKRSLIGCGTTTDNAAQWTTALGVNAGSSLTTGVMNSLLGYKAGGNIAAGERNTVVGTEAATGLRRGIKNTFIGFKAGHSITEPSGDTASNNMAAGAHAGEKLTSGDGNVFVGKDSGRKNTSGSENIFIGFKAGVHTHTIPVPGGGMTTGSENIIIGSAHGGKFMIGAGGILAGDDRQMNIGNLIYGRLPARPGAGPSIPRAGDPGVVIHGTLEVSGGIKGSGVWLSDLQTRLNTWQTNVNNAVAAAAAARNIAAAAETIARRAERNTGGSSVDSTARSAAARAQNQAMAATSTAQSNARVLNNTTAWIGNIVTDLNSHIRAGHSSRVYKKNIRPFKDFEKALRDIETTPLFTYQFKAKESHPDKIRIGLIAEELPARLQLSRKPKREKAPHTHSHSHAAAKASPPAPDWPSVYGTLWAGIKALAARLDAFKASFAKDLSALKTALLKEMEILKSSFSKDLSRLKTSVLKETASLQANMSSELAARAAQTEAVFRKELAARDKEIKYLKERLEERDDKTRRMEKRLKELESRLAKPAARHSP